MRDDSRSILTLYRRLLSLRRDHPALSVGGWRSVPLPPSLATEVFAYERFEGDETLRILLNFGSAERSIPLEDDAAKQETWSVLLSTRPGRAGEATGNVLHLSPDEGVVLCVRIRPADDARAQRMSSMTQPQTSAANVNLNMA